MSESLASVLTDLFTVTVNPCRTTARRRSEARLQLWAAPGRVRKAGPSLCCSVVRPGGTRSWAHEERRSVRARAAPRAPPGRPPSRPAPGPPPAPPRPRPALSPPAPRPGAPPNPPRPLPPPRPPRRAPTPGADPVAGGVGVTGAAARRRDAAPVAPRREARREAPSAPSRTPHSGPLAQTSVERRPSPPSQGLERRGSVDFRGTPSSLARTHQRFIMAATDASETWLQESVLEFFRVSAPNDCCASAHASRCAGPRGKIPRGSHTIAQSMR